MEWVVKLENMQFIGYRLLCLYFQVRCESDGLFNVKKSASCSAVVSVRAMKDSLSQIWIVWETSPGEDPE